jgi:hypothetical protein
MANATQVELLTEPLTGKELLQKVKDLDELSRDEKAKACGYYTLTESGSPRVNMMKFLNALIEAEGIRLDGVGNSNGNGRSGRSASFRVTVQSNGNLLIGSTYTKQMGLMPGDEFEITLGRKHIRLKHMGDSGALLDDAED